ncbi:MAG TPA: ABC transporter substrate-binding protein [Candidatus Limnocylindrales bacterium]|nr:ABC transporter substrate-binding protein [Candidatus Limnocylindrales bacterium]
MVKLISLRKSILQAITLLFFMSAGAVTQGRTQTHARLGVLLPELGRPQSQSLKGLTDVLKSLGYIERKNLVIETRNAKGDRGALPRAADDLVARKVDVIFTTGTRATTAAAGVTGEIPIVFVHPGDPVAAGLVKSMTDPQRNLTGVAGFAVEKTEKRLALLKELIPELRELHILFDSNNSFSRDNVALAQAAAKKISLPVVEHGVKSADELKTTLTSMRPVPGAALFHIPDDLVEGEAEFVFTTARQKKLPSMFNDESWAIQGATAAYGPSNLDMGRRAGAMIGRILKNPKNPLPPIERADKFDFIINYRTATFIGMQVSPAVLKRADKIIR